MRFSWAAAWPVLFGVLIGLLAGGVLWLAIGPRRGGEVQLLPPPTATPLMVHVTGAVAQPGVYALPRGSRAQDALNAAGGALPEADHDAVNLAALLEDGEQLYLPFARLTTPAAPVEGIAGGPPPQSLPGGLVNINTATQEELESLPGIGPVMARAIIDHRTVSGAFANIEAIQDVVGIGPGIFEKIRDLIKVGG